MSDYLRQRQEYNKFGKPPKQQKVYSIPKKSAKKLKEEKDEKERLGGDDTELVKWFKSKIKFSNGLCSECGCRVETKVYQYAVWTVAHILDKRDTKCPSVKTHPSNFLILCPDHHNMFDSIDWSERETWGCWPVVRDRLVMMYDALEVSERRHFPPKLAAEIESQNPFK